MDCVFINQIKFFFFVEFLEFFFNLTLKIYFIHELAFLF